MTDFSPDNVKAQLNRGALKSHLTYLNIIGIIIFIIGLLMTYYIYISSFNFILGLSGFDASWIIRLVYLIIIAFIGCFLVRQAMLLLKESRVLSIIILMIGLAFLIFTFWTAQIFIEMQYQFNEFTLIGLIFFGIMVVTSLFFFGTGISGLIKIRNQGTSTGTEGQSYPGSSQETEAGGKANPPDLRQEEFKICQGCFSKIPRDNVFCTICGKKQG